MRVTEVVTGLHEITEGHDAVILVHGDEAYAPMIPDFRTKAPIVSLEVNNIDLETKEQLLNKISIFTNVNGLVSMEFVVEGIKDKLSMSISSKKLTK